MGLLEDLLSQFTQPRRNPMGGGMPQGRYGWPETPGFPVPVPQGPQGLPPEILEPLLRQQQNQSPPVPSNIPPRDPNSPFWQASSVNDLTVPMGQPSPETEAQTQMAMGLGEADYELSRQGQLDRQWAEMGDRNLAGLQLQNSRFEPSTGEERFQDVIGGGQRTSQQKMAALDRAPPAVKTAMWDAIKVKSEADERKAQEAWEAQYGFDQGRADVAMKKVRKKQKRRASGKLQDDVIPWSPADPDAYAAAQGTRDERQEELRMRGMRKDANLTARQRGVPLPSAGTVAREDRINRGVATADDMIVGGATGDQMQARLNADPQYRQDQKEQLAQAAYFQGLAEAGLPVPPEMMGLLGMDVPAPVDPEPAMAGRLGISVPKPVGVSAPVIAGMRAKAAIGDVPSQDIVARQDAAMAEGRDAANPGFWDFATAMNQKVNDWTFGLPDKLNSPLSETLASLLGKFGGVPSPSPQGMSPEGYSQLFTAFAAGNPEAQQMAKNLKPEEMNDIRVMAQAGDPQAIAFLSAVDPNPLVAVPPVQPRVASPRPQGGIDAFAGGAF